MAEPRKSTDTKSPPQPGKAPGTGTGGNVDGTAGNVGGGVAASFASLKTGLDGLILNTVLTASAAGSTGGSKEPLSLQTTSNNFRKFVQKSGPIFAMQDAAEAVFRWDDVPKTVFFGAAWAFLCLYPALVLILPNIILTAILLYTHSRHVPVDQPDGEDLGSKLGSFAPPAEGSVDYLANLTNIQAMMGQISDVSDLLRSFAPYLTWRDPRQSLVLLQLSVLSSVLILFVYPFIPFRYVFLILGETALLAGHPISQSLFKETSPLLNRKQKVLSKVITTLIEEDGMGEDELEGELREVERFDTETRQDGVWGTDLEIGGELPVGKGWRWVRRSEWRVDLVGGEKGGGVDDAGWAYLYIDGTRSASPSGPMGLSNTRRRRLTRRAVRPTQNS
ncbi:hypothetical protein T439DRAFT_328999 [Meredithblackwellia eburnea MCA 4105]